MSVIHICERRTTMYLEEIRKIMSTQRPIGFLCPHCGNWVSLPTKNKDLNWGSFRYFRSNDNHEFTFTKENKYPEILCINKIDSRGESFIYKPNRMFQFKVENGIIVFSSLMWNLNPLDFPCQQRCSIEARQEIANIPFYKFEDITKDSSKLLRVYFAMPCHNSVSCMDCQSRMEGVCIGFEHAVEYSFHIKENGIYFGNFIMMGFEYSVEPHQLPPLSIWNNLTKDILFSYALKKRSVQAMIDMVNSFNSICQQFNHPVNNERIKHLNEISSNLQKQEENLNSFIDDVKAKLVEAQNQPFLKNLDKVLPKINMARGTLYDNMESIQVYFMSSVAGNAVAEPAIPKLKSFQTYIDKIEAELNSLKAEVLDEQNQLFNEIGSSYKTS